MNEIAFYNRYNPLLFKRFKNRLKSQAKIISTYLDIATANAYELIAILWGLESWYQLTRLLKEIESIHLSFRLSDFILSQEQSHSLCWKLTKLTQFTRGYASKGWFNREYSAGIYASIASKPPSDFVPPTFHSGEFFDLLNDAEDDYNVLFDSIVHRTAWLQNRFVFSREFEDHVSSMHERIHQYKGDITRFKLPEYQQCPFKIDNVITLIFGLSKTPTSYEKFLKPYESTEWCDLYRDAKPRTFRDLSLFKLMEPSLDYQMRLVNFLEQVAYVDMGLTNIAHERFCSIGTVATHLSDDAMVTFSLSGDLILINNISVLDESHIPALLACISTNPICAYKVNNNAIISGDNLAIKSKYLGGYTAYWE